MKMELTALIISQAKTFAVMLAAGILIESMWQGKCRLQKRMRAGSIRKGAREWIADTVPKRTVCTLWFLAELIFWAASAAALSGFLYYAAHGKPSLHAATGFFIGLLLWKKILTYVIMNAKV